MSPIIAIVGRPNVGKSTLFNRLSKSSGALVDNCPGVTRDRLEISTDFEGRPLTLVDTGGFDDLANDPLLDKVKDQVKTAIEEADRIIFMVDGRQGIMPGDEEIAQILRMSKKKTLLVVNKADGPEHGHMISDFCSLGLDPIFPISAAHGYGVKSFMEELVKDLPAQEPDEAANPDQIRVAVLGKPNVGKSSLINRILGSERLVVSDLPGTTRDAVDTRFFYRGKEYLLIDTAGIRRKARVKEKIEKFSMIKSLECLNRCHIALVLIDAQEGVSEQDVRILGYAFERARGVILVVNKWDLIKNDAGKKRALDNEIDRQLNFIPYCPRINLSAMTGERVIKLFDTINLLFEQFSSRMNTGAVNRAIQEIIEKHPPPRIGHGRLKFFYATQIRTRPPTFVAFVNRPDMIHFSYERFLINHLRSHFRLDISPIKLLFRKR
jgi:GTP-binding protein